MEEKLVKIFVVIKKIIFIVFVLCLSCKKPSREDVLKRCAMTAVRSAFGTFVSYEKKRDTLINDSLYKAVVNIKLYNIANEYRERTDTITLMLDWKIGWKCK